jgi:hypothetical protein
MHRAGVRSGNGDLVGWKYGLNWVLEIFNISVDADSLAGNVPRGGGTEKNGHGCNISKCLIYLGIAEATKL